MVNLDLNPRAITPPEQGIIKKALVLLKMEVKCLFIAHEQLQF